MAKFDKVNNNKVKEVAKASEEKANVLQVKMINTDNLVDYPKNNEDVTYTADLELSIEQNGFTDPIEVTPFGMEEGKFMIVSGHRRRAAGVKKGIATFPCIVKTFKSDADVQNYVLLANSQRDSSKDPLLFVKRYGMHEEYLKESGFKGSIREEIARRLGISVQHADRYKQMTAIIYPVWDMIRAEKVGMSSVLPMAQYTAEQQEEIVEIFNDCLANGGSLTRENCKKLIDAYKSGKKTYVEIMQMEFPMNPPVSGGSISESVSVMSINPEPEETKEEEISPLGRNNEVNHDFTHREGLGVGDEYADERLTEDDMAVIEMASKNKGKSGEEKPQLTEEEEKLASGKKLFRLLSNLDTTMEGDYALENKDEAYVLMKTLVDTASIMFAEVEEICHEYGVEEDKYKSLIAKLERNLNAYK